jgi:tRNA-dihydrouridine synthase
MGSGNIFAPLMAKKMLDETGCDGFLVARGALGNPWLFRNIEHYLQTGETLNKPALEVREKVLAKHLAYIEKYNDMKDSNKTGFMGRVTKWYL